MAFWIPATTDAQQSVAHGYARAFAQRRQQRCARAMHAADDQHLFARMQGPARCRRLRVLAELERHHRTKRWMKIGVVLEALVKGGHGGEFSSRQRCTGVRINEASLATATNRFTQRRK